MYVLKCNVQDVEFHQASIFFLINSLFLNIGTILIYYVITNLLIVIFKDFKL